MGKFREVKIPKEILDTNKWLSDDDVMNIFYKNWDSIKETKTPSANVSHEKLRELSFKREMSDEQVDFFHDMFKRWSQQEFLDDVVHVAQHDRLTYTEKVASLKTLADKEYEILRKSESSRKESNSN